MFGNIFLVTDTLYVFILLQDFGDSIPGHGGFTDRMDCQVQTFPSMHVNVNVKMSVPLCIF